MKDIKYTDILKENRYLRESLIDSEILPIKVLSNLTLNQINEILSHKLLKKGLNPNISFGSYDNIIQDSFRCSGAKIVIVHYELLSVVKKNKLFVEDFSDSDITDLYQTIVKEIDFIVSNLKDVPLVIFDAFTDFGIYTLSYKNSKASKLKNDLNSYLRQRVERNFFIIDLDLVISRTGISNSFDYKMYFLSKTLYTIAFWKEYASAVLPPILKSVGKLKKAVIFDCDNTLWKGILGEDGEAGIEMSADSKLGEIFNYIQKIAVWLSSQGVLIGLCSKNNYDDVYQVLVNHPMMVLTLDNIVISRINWQDKVSNLREIAKELNIGLDSLIFVDDSSFEINLVKEQLPEVLAFQVPVELYRYPELLLSCIEENFCFLGTKDDIAKTHQYKTQVLRNEEKMKFSSLEDYLSSLDIKIVAHKNDLSEINRIAQLTQKTNQFNLTTKRYTEVQIESMMKSNTSDIYSFTISDKFGDSGLTAVAILNKDNDIIVIDSFIQSCRIMGRNIEFAIMDYLIKQIQTLGVKIVKAMYYPTEKNKPVVNFYDSAGFNLDLDVKSERIYSLSISKYILKEFSYIKIIE